MIDKHDINPLLAIASARPESLMNIEACRQYLAAVRFHRRGQTETLKTLSAGVMPGAIDHNLQETQQGLFGSSRRTQRLLGPLSALDPVYSHAGNLKVLSIGPRTEMELLHLMGIGFREENIRGLDLISTSPLIDVGDMHAMPYPDNSFDVVISGWVLTYSKTPGKAIQEIVRVCKPGGLIAIGTTYAPDYGKGYVAGTKDDPENIVGSMFRWHSEFTKYIDELGVPFTVVFKESPPSDNTKGPVMMIARVK